MIVLIGLVCLSVSLGLVCLSVSLGFGISPYLGGGVFGVGLILYGLLKPNDPWS